MPQETNLNVSPYFDDFNEDKNFNRVLFKPATPIQARELTQLQSILQNQIERFGQHFFKEGSQVIPGQIAYDSQYNAVELTESFLGIQLTNYIDQLVGKTIKGEQSGVVAKVVNNLTATKSDRGNNTLYVKYQKSGDDFETVTFQDGENLICTSDIEYGNTRIVANNPFAACIPSNACSIGSAASIADGVYFVRGFFVKVTASTVILDQYTNDPTCRVGLFISENLVTAYSDDTLFDNASGFSNYAAPGADRLQLQTTLIRKDIDEFNDENFVELMRLKSGNIEKFVEKTDYNILKDELARRTYETSGDYYVKPFQVNIKESLNNRQGNGGIYYKDQKTAEGNDPSKDLMVYQMSPGKAYVKGYDIKKITSTNIDVEKPRTIKTIESDLIPVQTTSSVIVNNVYGSPKIGFGSTATIDLYTDRINSGGSANGTYIGNAKVYDFKLENTPYANVATNYEVSLYDVQTFTVLTVNTAQTLSTPIYVEGARSGASGYLKSNVSSSVSLTLTGTKGAFIVDEPLKINGVQESVSVTSVVEYDFGDVKSFHQNNSPNVFTADLDLTEKFSIAPPGTQFTITSGGTVTVPGKRFAVGIKTGDIVSYNLQSNSDITYNKVSALSADGSTMTVVACPQDIAGVCDKDLPGGTVSPSDFGIVKPALRNAQNSRLTSNLPQRFISSVDLKNAQLLIRKQYVLNISSKRGTVTVDDPDLFFQPFDEEDYNLTYSDGSIETLSSQNVQFNADFKTITLRSLTKTSDTNAVLVTTLKKINVTSKAKTLSKCAKVTFNRSKHDYSGTNTTSFNNGLTYNAIYGTRVEDDQICLNVPDGLRVHAIFESSGTSDPSLPGATLINRSDALTNTIQGEQVLGVESGALGQVVSTTTSTFEVVYKNEFIFQVGETLIFQSSGITGEVSQVVAGDKNIGEDFQFDNGDRKEYLDYCRIVREPTADEPKKRITVVFDHYVIDAGSGGDVVTVNSYPSDAFEYDLPKIRGRAATDFVDIRPRVKDYSTGDSDSPFEYDYRDFSSTGASAANILVPNEALILGYSYYLGRIDKILLSRDGFFEIKKGAPSENPIAPDTPTGGFLVSTVFNAPYIRNATYESNSILSSHKRYTMFDIGRLENRVKNIEFYTQLSLLETETSNLNIRDAGTGLDRFKSGFFVDNFRGHGSHSISHPLFKASVDKAKGECRPSHYTTSYDLLIGSEQVVGIGTTADPNADLTQVSDLQSNSLQRTGDVVTLKYTESKFIEQKFATTVENVNPFAVINWVGVITLSPASDTWLDEKHLDVNNIIMEGEYQSLMAELNIDPNTGFSPIDWGAWEEDWSSVDVAQRELGQKVTETDRKVGNWSRGFTEGGELLPPIHGGHISRTRKIDIKDTIETEFEETTTVTTGLSRSGVQFNVTERWDTESLGTRLVNKEIIPYMRSRNIEFTSYRIKPRTQFYPFLDGQDIAKYCTPKLVEIEMQSGVFQVGETVIGTTDAFFQFGVDRGPHINFRVAQTNHKFGAYNNPEITYAVNPYSDTVGLSSTYSATSGVLNVDCGSLQLEVLGDFYGYISKGMKLVGQTSGAEAIVQKNRLITDEKGNLLGTIFVPDNDTSISAPQFTTGTKTFRLSSSKVNSQSPVDNPSTAETTYAAEGTLDIFQEDILSVRNADVSRQTFSDSTVRTNTTQKTFKTQSFENRTVFQNQWYDPLAQSFEITEDNGVFITSLDVFFKSKDSAIPVTAQIRTMLTGMPTSTIVPFGEVIYEPTQINLSNNGTIATNFKFPSPVYLEPGEYAIVLLSASNDYECFISVMEQEDITTADLPESERIIVSQQPYMGSLFKSQNGSTWTPAQFEDLKFSLYKAQFVQEPGTLKYYNPELGVGKLGRPKLRNNPLTFLSQEIRVGLGSTVQTQDFSNGSRLTQVSNLTAEGNIIKSLGKIKIDTLATAAGGITTNSVGTGLTPSGSNLTYTGIALTTITGEGSGAVANIQVVSGGVGVVTVTTGGNGYAVGDVLGCNLGETGKNLRFNVGIVSATNAFILDKVVGDFNTSTELMTINAVGVASTLVGSLPATISNTYPYRDGLHVKVNHRNHGMHSRTNRVTISGAVGVQTAGKVSEVYPSTSTEDIRLDSASVFSSFENVGVSTTNPGYVKIGNEILEYTGVNGASTPNRLTGITRNIDNTKASEHKVNDTIYKYESSGVSLRRINKTHSFADIDSNINIGLDEYYIKVDTTATGVGTVRDGTSALPKLKISETEKIGRNSVRATQNTQFETITPNIQFMTPRDTGISARMRTTSATSVDGSETSFVDQGFEAIDMGGSTSLSSPRIIASKINESNNLTSLPGNKSFTMELVFETEDINVSPVIDTDRAAIITTTNRIDRPITNFADDPRVNARFGDPNSAIYISKKINLENPATFLQVKLAGYRPDSGDIRVLYKLFRADSISAEQPFELFPGYDNLTDTNGDGFGNQVIDSKSNNGRPDKFVPAARFDGDWRDYQFTNDKLPEFNGFQVKIIMSGTNQANPPRIKDLRVIAFA